ncbi:MAG: winged helix-turn-helix transcriptional regulator [Thaumarchaeota archaeon]|nr:winged helix-turn-helix transcriptional regulator [Nitrososphaerota archaeon]MDE1840894.1 winged helix-turn-helix transcriptional regulator [Nitrososphaerota archaeon]MDE1877461.1 winged helix-turn-helix transcriptional regulator [Nitrososphaerota archaeon]
MTIELATFFDTSDIKILFYLYENNETRYSELERSVVKTRSMLSVSLRDLSKRKLIDRMVGTTKPIQTRYKLTDKDTKLV